MSQHTPFPRAGVMGWPIRHSLSPLLHRFWLQSYGIKGSYEAFPVAPTDLSTALQGLKRQELRGVNLTIPHKEAALHILDDCEPLALRIGAINLVTMDDAGKLWGRNTDAYGFTQSLLSSGFVMKSGKALILGAGGAARAIIVALIDMGFKDIRLANRTPERAEKLAYAFSTPQCHLTPLSWPDIPQALSSIELLINTTSLGMIGQPELALPLHNLPLSATVTDIVYTPLQTSLLRNAHERGHPVVDGLGMLLHQARPSFAAFFGQDPVVTEELRHFVLSDRK